jgi:hypothetical protein
VGSGSSGVAVRDDAVTKHRPAQQLDRRRLRFNHHVKFGISMLNVRFRNGSAT